MASRREKEKWPKHWQGCLDLGGVRVDGLCVRPARAGRPTDDPDGEARLIEALRPGTYAKCGDDLALMTGGREVWLFLRKPEGPAYKNPDVMLLAAHLCRLGESDQYPIPSGYWFKQKHLDDRRGNPASDRYESVAASA